MENENKNKYDFLLLLLREGDAMVCLDARHPGVAVPAMHQDNPALNLIFNLNFRRPLDITEEGIFATLAFSGRPFKCVIPFEAVWAMFDPSMKESQIWEESVPRDIEKIAREMASPPEKTGLKTAQNRPPSEPGVDKPSRPKTSRGHLRVIK